MWILETKAILKLVVYSNFHQAAVPYHMYLEVFVSWQDGDRFITAGDDLSLESLQLSLHYLHDVTRQHGHTSTTPSLVKTGTNLEKKGWKQVETSLIPGPGPPSLSTLHEKSRRAWYLKLRAQGQPLHNTLGENYQQPFRTILYTWHFFSTWLWSKRIVQHLTTCIWALLIDYWQREFFSTWLWSKRIVQYLTTCIWALLIDYWQREFSES